LIAPDTVAQEQARLSGGGGTISPASLFAQVQNIMWSKAGVVSNRQQLTEAIAELQEIRRIAASGIDTSDIVAAEDLRNLALTAELVATAKLAREETRSGHGRTDFRCRTKAGPGMFGSPVRQKERSPLIPSR
jgi:fumarate reductase (CoM/CoB) subunit A